VVIAAGGAGRRYGGSIPKQFLRLGGIPVLQRTIAAFHALRAINEIIVVVPPGHVRRTGVLVRRAGFSKVSRVIPGGRERQDSVWSGLNAFTSSHDLLLVHDAVRPLATRTIIEGVIAAAGRHGAAVAGVPVRDTIKIERRKGFFAGTLDRSSLWAVQTPQGFRSDILLCAHREARHDRFLGTDEASLVERLGVPVRIVPGDERNLKITTRNDLRVALMYLKTGRP
jgi:2-C-methyl-D-erythritol 4-phosphate cytidylyltransferase